MEPTTLLTAKRPNFCYGNLTMTSDDPGRRHPQRQPVHESGNLTPIIFLTVCTKDRKKLLAHDLAHAALRSAWKLADAYLIGRYIILPDHLHLFCTPASLEAPELANWVRFWKSRFSREYGTADQGKIWHASFWDTQLRRGEHYSQKWEYVRANPVRHGLAERAENWPFQGELNIFDWHDQ
jgi:putative transposase